MKLKNDLVQAYLSYVENTTESPRIFHVWSLLTSIGSCLGRRCWFELGRLRIFPNEFVLLVGPPGVRKSDAIGVIETLMQRATNVRYAPADTGGARQGLIAAMRGDQKEDQEDRELIDLIESGSNLLDLANNAEINVDDAHTMYVMADEFTTFIGLNSTDMITFLLKVYDGKDYIYRVKNEFTTLYRPLLSMLGGTNPTALSQALPASAIGGGFMSRTVLVYGNKKYKHLAEPDHFDTRTEEFICERLRVANKDLVGSFEPSDSARKALADLYQYEVKINDPRFIYYVERRHSHLVKLVSCLAAARGSLQVSVQDIEEAQLILSETEKSMVEALGEFGLSPLGAAKQKLLEFIQHSSPAPVHLTTLNIVLKRDMKQLDMMASLADLVNSGKIKQTTTPHGSAYLYIPQVQKLDELIDSMIELGSTKVKNEVTNVGDIEL